MVQAGGSLRMQNDANGEVVGLRVKDGGNYFFGSLLTPHNTMILKELLLI